MPELIDMVRASAWGQPLKEQPKAPKAEDDLGTSAALTVEGLKELLTVSGVPFDPKAKKVELLELVRTLPNAGGSKQISANKPEGEAPKE